jgi:hypothetical protein
VKYLHFPSTGKSRRPLSSGRRVSD